MNRRWICTDIWMDMFPFFDRPQLGLKLALISPRFEILVAKHFDGKRELTILREITIEKDNVAAVPKLSVLLANYDIFAEFPLPDFSLPNKIRFRNLLIMYIDHFVLAFLHANQHIWDKGTKLFLEVDHNNGQRILDVFVRRIWPIFAPNIRHLFPPNAPHLDNFLRLISPSILSDDLHQLDLIDSGYAFDDWPNATSVGQILFKWLHIPCKDGRSKLLFCHVPTEVNHKWVNSFKQHFLLATTYANYKIQFQTYSLSMVPFELVNKRTNEKLILQYEDGYGRWIMKRCPIGETALIQWENENKNLENLSIVHFCLCNGKSCIGPMSPPAPAEEEAGQSQPKKARHLTMSAGPSNRKDQ